MKTALKCRLPVDPPEPVEADFLWHDEVVKAEQEQADCKECTPLSVCAAHASEV